MKTLFLNLIAMSSLIAANDFYYEFDKKVEIQNTLKTKSLNNTNEIQEYTTTEDKTIKFKNEIIVQCKKNQYCEDDFSDLNLTNYEEIASNYFLIKLESHQDIFSISQQLYLKDDIQVAHPNYIKTRSKR